MIDFIISRFLFIILINLIPILLLNHLFFHQLIFLTNLLLHFFGLIHQLIIELYYFQIKHYFMHFSTKVPNP